MWYADDKFNSYLYAPLGNFTACPWPTRENGPLKMQY